MRFSLLPELTDAQKRSLSEWVAETLPAPGLIQGSVIFPMNGQLGFYVGSEFRMIHRNDNWQFYDRNVIYIGYRNPTGNHPMPLIDRLAVVGAVISLADLWETHHEQYTTVMSSVLIESYQGLMSGMVQTEAAVSGLAFNESRGVVAARIGDCYHLPSGELVEIDDSWTVVADRPSVRTVPVAAAA